ncbi:MAG: hypothetical protein FWH19_04530 [Treponema sp.]|nr:hypothetical protein [Treponema sp.]
MAKFEQAISALQKLYAKRDALDKQISDTVKKLSAAARAPAKKPAAKKPAAKKPAAKKPAAKKPVKKAAKPAPKPLLKK